MNDKKLGINVCFLLFMIIININIILFLLGIFISEIIIVILIADIKKA